MDKKQLACGKAPSTYEQSNVNQQMGMGRKDGILSLLGFNHGEANRASVLPTEDQLLMQLDPWLQPNRTSRHNFRGLLSEVMGIPGDNHIRGIPTNGNYMMNTSKNHLNTISPWLHEIPISSLHLIPLIRPPLGPMQRAILGISAPPMQLNQQMGTYGNSSMENLNCQEVAPLTFNPQVNRFPNVPINCGQNLNMIGSVNSSRTSSLVNDQSFGGMGLHEDPFLRMYNVQGSNGNITDANGCIRLPQNQNKASSKAPASQSTETTDEPVLTEELIEEMINSMLTTPEDQEEEDEEDGSGDDTVSAKMMKKDE